MLKAPIQLSLLGFIACSAAIGAVSSLIGGVIAWRAAKREESLRDPLTASGLTASAFVTQCIEHALDHIEQPQPPV